MTDTDDTDALTKRLRDNLIETYAEQDPRPDFATVKAVKIAHLVAPIVEAEVRAAKAEAWDEGHSWGWSDAQDAHDVRQTMDRADWSLNTPNPYRQETDR